MDAKRMIMHRCNNRGKTFEDPYKRVGVGSNSVLYCPVCYKALEEYHKPLVDKKKKKAVR